MRDRIDCALLEFGATNDMIGWTDAAAGAHANGRLHLHAVKPPADGGDHAGVLTSMAIFLQRYDVCLLAARADNLAVIRRLLAAVQGTMRTPVIVLAHALTARAIHDLYSLGMADFVCHPLCPEELRLRSSRVLGQRSGPPAAPDYVMPVDSSAPRLSDVLAAGLDPAVRTALMETAAAPDADTPPVVRVGEEALRAFAVASASWSGETGESLRSAKNRVVVQFERAYLLASLAKSSGNIAMAARGAQKNRRAYWALMRKYNIDAAPFRKGLSLY